MKIYFTYNNDTREGLESKVPLTTSTLEAESVDEIQGQYVLERVPCLISFIDECYRLLKKDGKCLFSGFHFGSSLAWQNPLNIRGLSELSLNFASKDWREKNKWTEASVMADFEVTGQFAVETSFMSRSEEARGYAMRHYNNVAQAILFNLVKK